ncbi:MAG: OmpA family protein [Acetobacteraceae bacterium]|jgi:outer membrane protein OmpA-like peptidoglycan-associated protein
MTDIVRYLLFLLLWCAWLTAAAQETGKTDDLIYPPPAGLTMATGDLKFIGNDVSGANQSLLAKTQDLQVKETATEIRIELNADVLFDFDKSTIKPEAAAALHNVGEIIQQKGNGRAVRIDGYTDGKGSVAYNLNLSDHRAESVKLWLAQKEGITQARMTTRGLGAGSPVAPNTNPDGSDNPDGRQKNRRVEIVMSK